jgi:tetratricopeptide (TPR) repeat protein
MKRTPGALLLICLLIIVIAASVGCTSKGSPGPSGSKSPGQGGERISPADKYLDLAQERYINKDYSNAVAQGELALNACEQSPNPKETRVKVVRFLSYAYAKTKNYAKAEEMLQELLKEDPKNQDYLASLKEIRVNTAAKKRARALKKLAEADKNYKDGNFSDCVDNAEEARQLLKESKGTQAQIAAALALKGKSDIKTYNYDDAVSCLKEAVKLDPSNSGYRDFLAQASDLARKSQVGATTPEPVGGTPPGIPGGTPTGTTPTGAPPSGNPGGTVGGGGAQDYTLNKVTDGVYSLTNSKNGKGFGLRIMGPRHYQFFDLATNAPFTTRDLGSDTYEVSDTKKGYKWKVRVTPEGQIEFEEIM